MRLDEGEEEESEVMHALAGKTCPESTGAHTTVFELTFWTPLLVEGDAHNSKERSLDCDHAFRLTTDIKSVLPRVPQTFKKEKKKERKKEIKILNFCGLLDRHPHPKTLFEIWLNA